MPHAAGDIGHRAGGASSGAGAEAGQARKTTRRLARPIRHGGGGRGDSHDPHHATNQLAGDTAGEPTRLQLRALLLWPMLMTTVVGTWMKTAMRVGLQN